MQKFKPQSCISNFCNKSNLSTPCFAAFHSVWVHLGPFRYCMKFGAKWAELVQIMKRSSHKVVSEFFAMNAPDPPHWTLNLCFVLFRSVWVHFGPFRCFAILGSKRAELLKLMQKLKPQSCVRFFCNKSTLSTPSGPKLMFGAFHSVWVHLGPFRYCMKLGAKWAELVQLMQKFVPGSRVGFFHNKCTQSTSLNPELIFCCIS